MSVASPIASVASVPASGEPPRRQSCDRCHEKKVRCIQDGQHSFEGTKGKTAICVGCKRSGRTCTYSPLLRPGRPRINRPKDSTANSGKKKRARQKVPPTESSSPVPTPFSTIGDAPCLNTSLLLPQPVPMEQNLGSVTVSMETESEFKPDYDWMQHYHGEPEANHFSVGHSRTELATQLLSLPPFAHLTPDTLYSDDIEDTNCPEPDTPVLDQAECDIERLIELTAQVSRCARTIPMSSAAPLSVSSPCISELYDATCTLVDIVDGLAAGVLDEEHGPARYRASFLGGFEPTNCLQNTLATPADSGVLLMALAAHERLLAMFEKTIVSIQRQIRSGPSNSGPASNRRGRQLGAHAFMNSATTQGVMLVKLLSHLFDRLDQAFGPLAMSSGNATPDDIALSYTPSSSIGSPLSVTTPLSPVVRHAKLSELGCGRDFAIRSDRMSLTTQLAVDAMQRRQDRLRTNISLTKTLIKQNDCL